MIPWNIEKLVDRIVQDHDAAIKSRQPAYNLVLGSGFSLPVIPSTEGLVDEAFWWSHCEQSKLDFFREDAKQANEASGALAAHRDPFLKKFESRVTAADAFERQSILYTLVNSVDGPLFNAKRRTMFMHDICKKAEGKVNDSHLLLASIIKKCPNLVGTIFTTNFDPLLQRSLQLLNTLYRVRDNPETLEWDDQSPVVEVVYVHGSINTYLLTDQAAMAEYVTKNSPSILDALKKRGVIVLGYGGWENDLIMGSLRSTGINSFEGNIYWCDVVAEVERLRPCVRSFLIGRSDCVYVNLDRLGAVSLMEMLHKQLHGSVLPDLVADPLKSMLVELGNIQVSSSSDTSTPQLGPALKGAVTLLESMGRVYAEVAPRDGSIEDALVHRAVMDGRAAQAMVDANRALAEERLPQAIALYGKVIDDTESGPIRTLAYLARGIARELDGQEDGALSDWRDAQTSPDADSTTQVRAFVVPPRFPYNSGR